MREVIYFQSQPRLEGNRVHGYAAKFGILSHDLGGYRTRLRPGCFDRAFQNLDCTLNLGHDDSRLLGRTTSGTLRLAVDDTGLYFDADLPNTTDGHDARELLSRGDFDACSFAISAVQAEWIEEPDILVREIYDLDELLDVSIVVRPAFPSTEVTLHSLSLPKPRLLKARLRQLRTSLCL